MKNKYFNKKTIYLLNKIFYLLNIKTNIEIIKYTILSPIWKFSPNFNAIIIPNKLLSHEKNIIILFAVAMLRKKNTIFKIPFEINPP